MALNLIAALGAGFAAAVLFIIPVKGTMAAMMLAVFAPLPIMIAGLAFKPAIALLAAFVGVGGTAILLHPLPAAIFALWAAVPAWWLSRLAWLARPPEGHETPSEDGLVWYPAGRIVMWAAIFGAAATFLVVFSGMIRFGGYDAFMSTMTKAMTALFEQLMKTANPPKTPRGMDAAQFAHFFLRSVLPQMAAWGCLMLSINMWLAGRITLSSQRLRRPWPDIAQDLKLPKWFAGVLALALLGMMTSGLFRMIAAIMSAAAFAAFALQGFAVLHYITRGIRNRTLNLTLTYMLNVFLFPVPALITALLGIADNYFDIRGRYGRPPAPPASKSGWPPPPANSN
ncbi:MAG: DUF2232 domain-containing protein [Hyphomicrobiales bacterium]|nr:DUF2232 domain-containing protein [Hyphomicrobiales bacterium]